MLRKITFLAVIALLVLLSGKSSESPIPNATIFFIFKGEENVEIWMVNRDGTSPESLYKIPNWSTFALAQNQIITPEITAELKAKPFLWKGDEKLETSIFDIHLSPNQQMLSWRENVDWCPGNYCVGQSSIKILSLKSKAIIASYVTTYQIGTTSWSPDSRDLVFDETSIWKPGPEYTINLLNVISSEQRQLAEGRGPVFLKTPDRILSYNRTTSSEPSYYQITNISAETTEKFPFSESRFGAMALSPNDSDLAGIVYKDNLFTLRIVDLQTRQFEKLNVPFDKQIYAMKWSPDSKKLAVQRAFFNLIVLKTTGETELNLEDIVSWDWAENSDNILFTKRNTKFGCNAIDPYLYIISLSNGNLLKIDFPSPVKEHLIGRKKYVCLDNLIDEITW